jgi:gliding motility-associated-like protein
MIQLGNDTIIQQGAGVRLKYTLQEGSAPVDSLFWEGIECINCPEVWVTPENETTYKVVVIDSLGCRSEDEITITIKQDETVTIPNIFSPNSQGGNKTFTVFGSKNLALVESLYIFDRWGNKVFESRNFPPNDAAYGWDGSFGTEIPVPGVYIYSCSVQFSSGRRITITGDVTLF